MSKYYAFGRTKEGHVELLYHYSKEANSMYDLVGWAIEESKPRHESVIIQPVFFTEREWNDYYKKWRYRETNDKQFQEDLPYIEIPIRIEELLEL